MRKTLFAAAAMAAFGITGTASAQYLTPTLDYNFSGFTVRGGVGLALDNRLADFSNVLTNLGIEYTLPSSLFKGGDTFLSVDVFFTGWGDGGTVWPIMINGRWYVGNSPFGSRSYVYVGTGATIINLTNSETVFGLRTGYGRELSDFLIFETGFHWSDSDSNNVKNIQLTLNFGYRF